MSEKNTFIMYADIDIEGLSFEQLGQLYKAQIDYANGNEVSVSDPEARGLWRSIKQRMDANAEKYRQKCERNKAIAEERERKKKEAESTNVHERAPKETNVHERVRTYSDSDNEYDPDNDPECDNDSDNDNESPTGINKKSVRRAHALKHAHGEYQNVRLTDDEYQKLKAELGEEKTSAVIEWFSRYIAEKGYKSKSHYLAIKRWVIEAVEERQQKKAREPTSEPEESAFDRTLKRMYEEAGHDRPTGD